MALSVEDLGNPDHSRMGTFPAFTRTSIFAEPKLEQGAKADEPRGDLGRGSAFWRKPLTDSIQRVLVKQVDSFNIWCMAEDKECDLLLDRQRLLRQPGHYGLCRRLDLQMLSPALPNGSRTP
jgi:hypothetical protein